MNLVEFMFCKTKWANISLRNLNTNKCPYCDQSDTPWHGTNPHVWTSNPTSAVQPKAARLSIGHLGKTQLVYLRCDMRVLFSNRKEKSMRTVGGEEWREEEKMEEEDAQGRRGGNKEEGGKWRLAGVPNANQQPPWPSFLHRLSAQRLLCLHLLC